MILITSGSYLNSEFTSILGQLPPSFLPVGNRRLYHWQARSFGDIQDQIVLTLPQDFKILGADAEALDDLGVAVLKMPSELTLGAAIVHAINACNAGNGPVRILHGDTLCGPLQDIEFDKVLTGTTSDNYPWAHCQSNEDGTLNISEAVPATSTPRRVVCGYFTFSNGGNLAQCLTLANYDFVAGLDLYARTYGLSEQTCSNWLDFGHVPLYYRSKAQLTTERAFNSLAASPTWVDKTSEDQAKIEAEASWYEALPRDIQLYTPRFLGRKCDDKGQTAYRLEYLYLSTLSELSVFGNLPATSWHPIFSRLDALMTLLRANLAPAAQETVTATAYLDKTMSRLTEFARCESIDLSAPTCLSGTALPSLEEIAESVCGRIAATAPEDMTLTHGDLCFSNIFFDLRSLQIRMIDPRGRSFDGVISPYGDSRYDLAKLSHSVVGRYDTIMAGYYRLRRNSALDLDLSLPQQNNFDEVEQLFLEMTFAGRSPKDSSVNAIMISLFLSMLPLHYDNKDKQYALLANALRLFVAQEKLEGY